MKIEVRSQKGVVEGATVDIEYRDVIGFTVRRGWNDEKIMIYIEGTKGKEIKHKVRDEDDNQEGN